MSENTTTEVDTDATASTPSTGSDTSGSETSGPGDPRKRTRRQLLEREGEVAADFLETLLDIADLDGDIDLDIDGDRAAVAVVDSDEGRVPRRLVGQDGKVLEALQELTRLAVQSDTGDRSRLMLDVAGHRAARRAELVGIAGEAVASVKESGQSLDLEPMTAFERKVVHDEVLAAGLVSDSSGSEPRRFVVVHPAEEADADSDGPATQTTGTESTVADEGTTVVNETAAADSASGQAVGDDTSDPA